MKKEIVALMAAVAMSSCSSNNSKQESTTNDNFNYIVDRFADAEVLRYKVPAFENLTLQQKQLVYHLSEASLWGRDILFDQNNRYNLAVRRTLENIYANYNGDKNSADYKNLESYLKRIWFSNGIHHHYGEDKFKPEFSQAFFVEAVKSADASKLPLKDGQTVDAFIAEITPVIFDANVMGKRSNQTNGEDLILTSANNYYGDNLTQEEVEAFYASMKDTKDNTPVSHGLNSRVVKENGKVVEKVWKVGGLYTQALEKVVAELELAKQYAENDQQKAVIEALIAYYNTGDLKQFDAYAILWVNDTNSAVDFVNGFTETYGDPLGMKASWEATVNFRNDEATKRTQLISDNAQWFEDRSPVAKQFKKEEVKGVTAKVITVAMLGGDCYPTTPIGINLPNSNWIRRDHGSKSVTIENITEAYDKASQGNGFGEEFVWSDTERELLKNYGFLTDNLHTDLHECLGHGSGKLLPGVDPDALRAYGAPIEEARADLYGLYFMADAKTVELGLLPDQEAYKAQYYKYLMNGLLTQLVRIEPGKNVEQAHMRCRYLISNWVLQNGQAENVVELKQKDGKTFVVVNDYEKLRNLFGQLLSEIQRIKSEGDFNAAQNMIETYAVKVDPARHNEILARYKSLNLAPYRGFVNPVMEEVKNANGEVVDIKVSYDEDYATQMMRYSSVYSPLPTYND